jgi:hypothetical protein
MVQFTGRDDEMLRWLGIVRMADMDTIRYALGAFGGVGKPVVLRKAQLWVARLSEMGLVGRVKPSYQDRSVVWPTAKAVGRQAPSLLGQTTRHEIAVAAVSARYLLRGYVWRRDRKPVGMFEHEADGVATKGDIVELVEVELTAKASGRYKAICDSHSSRIAHDGVSRVVYPSTSDAARMVTRQADLHLFRTERPRLVAFTAFDRQGKWVARDDALWVGAEEPSGTGVPAELEGFELLEEPAR